MIAKQRKQDCLFRTGERFVMHCWAEARPGVAFTIEMALLSGRA